MGTRRTPEQRHKDHKRTVEKLHDLVGDVHSAEQDGLLHCGAIRLANRRIPWIHLSPGIMSLWWPYAESPHVVLFRDVPCKLKVRILDWTDDGFAIVSYRRQHPAKVAAWIDAVFQRVYNCKVGYDIDFEVDDLMNPAA